jgi:sugar phosphate isomerase/epimerase
MRARWVTIAVMTAVAFTVLQGSRTGVAAESAPAEETGFRVPDWKLGSQAYTFRRYSFAETIDRLKALGLHYVEAYPGQTLGGGLDGAFGHGMTPDTRAKVKAALDQAGVKLTAYGVVTGGSEAEWKQIFDFAKDMGITVITSEPDPAQMDLVASLCDQYAINLAIHNHPQPSRYWNPETVLAACKGRSARVGACGDTGHWARSGLDPLACLKQLEGRVISVHLKDLDALGNPGAQDVPWGSGLCNTDAMLTELARQGFAGLVSIEYEKDDDRLDANVAKCVEYFTGWDGPTRFADDIATVLAHVKPGPSGVWSNTWFGGAPAQGEGLGPQANTKGYIDTTDDHKGKVMASGPGLQNEGQDNAFDGTPSKWCINQSACWIGYQYADGARQKITAYTIMSANDSPGRDPKDWKLLGSTDTTNWTEVDSRTGENFGRRHEKRLFEVKNPGEFSSYKLEVTQNHGDTLSQIADLELLVKKP